MFSVPWAQPRLEVAGVLRGDSEYHSSTLVLISHWWDEIGGRVRVSETPWSSITVPKELCPHQTFRKCRLVWGAGQGTFLSTRTESTQIYCSGSSQNIFGLILRRAMEAFSKDFCDLLSVQTSQLSHPGSTDSRTILPLITKFKLLYLLQPSALILAFLWISVWSEWGWLQQCK